MRALWLPGVLRAAGLTVHEEPGWQTRGADTFGPLRGLICHATGGAWHPTNPAKRSTDRGELNVIRHGSTSAPPPISQLYLSRSGAWWVVASGTCNHARIGWGGAHTGYGNDALIGVEAQHANWGRDEPHLGRYVEPWTPTQLDAYAVGVAAICRHLGWGADRVAGHKEHQPGDKPDPTFAMGPFRAMVTDYLRGDDMPLNHDDVKRVAEAVWAYNIGPRNPDGTVPAQTRAAHYALGDAADQVDAGASRYDGRRGFLPTAVQRLEAALTAAAARDAASAQREQDMLTIVQALAAGGTSLDTAAILHRIDARTADVTGEIGRLTGRVAELEAELEQRRTADRVRAAAEAQALADTAG